MKSNLLRKEEICYSFLNFYYFTILVNWCPEPPEVNGGVFEITGRRVGSTATYTCLNGFILFGDNVSLSN